MLMVIIIDNYNNNNHNAYNYNYNDNSTNNDKKFGKNDDNDKIMIKFHLLKFFKTSFI